MPSLMARGGPGKVGPPQASGHLPLSPTQKGREPGKMKIR